MLKTSNKPDYILEEKMSMSELADYVVHYGDVALIVTDISTEQSGLRSELSEALGELGFPYEVIMIGEEWPSIEGVKRLWSDIEFRYEPNVVISMGESHVIHFAKAISILSPYSGPITDLVEGKGNVRTALPHLTIPFSNEREFTMQELNISDTIIIRNRDTDPIIQFSHREMIPKVVLTCHN